MKWNYKKMFSGVLAVSMVLGSFAMPDTQAASGGGTTGGSGGLEGYLSDVFNVVVPTELTRPIDQNTPYVRAFDFILDPKGLASIDSGTLVGKDLEPNASVFFENIEQGSPYDYSSTSDGFRVINKSTAAVDVTLEASLTGMDGVRLTGDKDFTNDKSASVFLALTDSKNKTSAIDKFGAVIKTTLKGQPDAYNVIVNSANKYEYEIKSDAVLEANNIKFADYIFRLTGACNSASSWSKLANYLSPEVNVTWSVALRPKKLAPSIPKTSYVMNMGKALFVDVDLGSGSLAATDIKSISYTTSSGSVNTLSTNNYVFEDSTLKFRLPYISGLLDEGVKSRHYTVVFNDSAATRKELTLVANDDIAPSIAQTEYSITGGQPVMIDIDLGAGTLGATGIKSITFVNSSGKTANVLTDKYTFVDGVLTFNAVFVDKLLNEGVVSRAYLITFNDKAETQVKVTLKADGSRPSIVQTQYEVERGKDVEINVDLGSESLAATGIQSVTFVNPSGQTTSVPTDRYTFADGVLTIKSPVIDAMFNAGIISRTYTIGFNDSAKTQVAVKLTAKDMKPSNADAEYFMTTGQAIEVNVDLGSGASGATAIKSITFVNSSGNLANVLTDKYTFADGVLTFKGTFIDKILGEGVTSRAYLITLNDAANSQMTVTLRAKGQKPSIAQTQYEVERGKNVKISVDLGSETLAATGIQSITFVNPSGVTTTVPTDRYTLAGGELTIQPSVIDVMFNAGVIFRTYTISFNDVAKTQVAVTLSAKDLKPSNVDAEYFITSGQAVKVNVDLGSGASGATGIKSITFVNSAGNIANVLTDKYTFADGVLTFKGTFIDKILGEGVTSRAYLITLNDTAGSQMTVTLTAKGQRPSIAQTQYEVERGKDVKINVDLGGETLAATGIQSITFVNPSGVTTTVPTDRYTLAGGELTIKSLVVDAVLNANVASRIYTISFNDVAKTQVKLTLTVPNIAPTIDIKEYTMVSGKAVDVKVNLGSGTLGATSIKSITYVEGSVTKTVSTSYYTLENGILKIRASYINGVISAKVTSRDYKVTFNDTAKTSVTIKLVK